MQLEHAPTHLRAQPSWLLNRAALSAQRLVTEAFGRVQAHRRQYAVLAALEESGPASQAELGRWCGIDRSDMVALLDELVTQHLVGRRTDPADRRRNVVTLTAGGRRRLRTLEQVVAEVQAELLAPLTSAEAKQLTRLLTKLVEHHAERPALPT